VRFRDLAYLVVSNLARMKLRLVLTSLGVVIGTSAIVLMLSLGIGLQRNITAELGQIGAATHINVMGGVFGPGMNEPKPLDDRAIREMESLEHVDAVMPAVSVTNIGDVSYKRYTTFLMVQGVPMEPFQRLGYEIEAGRLPRNDKEILLGAAVPASFAAGFGPQGAVGGSPTPDLIGKRLDVTFFEYPSDTADPMAMPTESTRRLTVVGLLAPSDMQTDQSAFVTLEAALEFNGVTQRRATYESVIVKVDLPASVADVEKVLTDQGYYTFSARSIQQSLNATFLIVQAVLGALGAIAMLVAALGIANTMTMSIYERTREIGIMKAVGASNRQIKRVFLGEAAIIGVLGGSGGLLFSISGAALANLFVASMIEAQTSGAGGGATQSSFFHIPPSLALFAIAFAAGVGLLSGVLPAMRAANLDPLTALRHE
jgi:putative ABC transport system permease protein